VTGAAGQTGRIESRRAIPTRKEKLIGTFHQQIGVFIDSAKPFDSARIIRSAKSKPSPSPTVMPCFTSAISAHGSSAKDLRRSMAFRTLKASGVMLAETSETRPCGVCEYNLASNPGYRVRAHSIAFAVSISLARPESWSWAFSTPPARRMKVSPARIVASPPFDAPRPGLRLITDFFRLPFPASL
jgi:hypothetical protein